jgi:hypothetical protein
MGQWSRLFTRSVIAAAELSFGFRVFGVSNGTGAAALAAFGLTDTVR